MGPIVSASEIASWPHSKQIPGQPCGETWDFLFIGRQWQSSDYGERDELRRSFRPGLPARNSHRSDATHDPMADDEGGSVDNQPYRLCSSLPAEPLSQSSTPGAVYNYDCRDDPGPDDPGPSRAFRLKLMPERVARMLLESFSYSTP